MSDLREPCNIGNPHEMTILQFAETIKAAVGSSSPIVFKPLPVDDPQTRQPDITQARERLGWDPKVALAEGLQSTIAYFRKALTEQGVLQE
jgi:dTDP-glucose 4,6-dehydratase